MKKKEALLVIVLFGFILILGNGELSFGEQDQGLAPAPGNNNKFTKTFDRNGDGVVSRDEFPGPDQVFHQYDLNGDGKVDVDEARIAKPADKSQQAVGQEGGRIFIEKFDKTSDGVVTRDEFPGPNDVYNSFDANGDGKVTPDEVRAKGPK